MIEQRDFSAGWIASDDAYNGRKNGMLQMDNLCLDENGALSLVRGSTEVSSVLADIPHTLFSRQLGANFYRYAALGNGTVSRDKNRAGTFGTNVLTGGSLNRRADFAAALNQIFIVTGNKYIKDNGTAQNNIGIADPTAPSGVNFGTPSQIDLQNLDGSSQFTNWSVDQGVLTYNNANGDMRFQTDPTSFQAVIRTVFGSAIDLTTYPSGGGWSTAGIQLITDALQFYVAIPDATQLASVTVRLLSFDPGSAPSTAAPSGSYYDFTWNYNDSDAPFSSNLWNLLSAAVGDFTQRGDTSQKFWNSIKAITVTFIAASQISLGFTEINEQGSSRAALNGDYLYFTQNVADTGTYQAVSKISAKSNQLHSENGAITLTLTPPVDAQTTSVNIFRQEINSQALPTFIANVIPATTSYTDGLSDVQQLSNSGFTANFFFQSIQTITDPILAIVGLYFGRMLYFTSSALYTSDSLDPDIFDTRYIIKYSGNAAEIFLWAKKVSNSTVLIGTNYDIYQLNGTLTVLPDGTLDATIRPLGVQYPPVSRAVAVEGNTVIYMANDGWRINAPGYLGDTSNNLTTSINLLYKGYARFGNLAVVAGYDDSSIARCAINKGKFYTIVTLTNNDQQIYVYDVDKKYWYTILRDPSCLFTEEDGTLIIGDSDSKIKILDTNNNYLSNGVQQNVRLLSPVFDGGTPRQRKDCFTLKFRIDTGNWPLVLTVFQDEVAIPLGTITANGDTEIILDTALFTLGKAYQFSLSGFCAFFKLYFFQLEYTDRPVQVTRLRIAPDNIGSPARKRAMTFPPLIIDTLGHNITFTPLIDNVIVPVINPTINTVDKTTVVPYFNSEILGVDFGGTLSGGLFEFYGLASSDWVSEKLPPKVCFQVVTEDNEGTISIKRRRTFPFVINTFGNVATVIPVVDGVPFPAQLFTTNFKQTVVYYFTTDVKGIDYRLKISSAGHEFYGILKSEEVQILPVGVLFTQVGPFEALRLAMLERFRVRLLTEGTLVNFNVFIDDNLLYNNSFTTISNVDKTYEVVVPKGLNGTTFRMEFSSDLPIHKYSAKIKLRITGGQADGKWVG